MRPPKQKQSQVKKGLCRVLEHVDVDVEHVDVDVDVDVDKENTSSTNSVIEFLLWWFLAQTAINYVCLVQLIKYSHSKQYGFFVWRNQVCWSRSS